MYNILLKNMPDKICGIYKIDFPNGKIYIGQSNNIRRRMYEHNNTVKNSKNKHCAVCDKAIIKYGPIVQIIVLEECSETELDEKEKYWISYYRSNDKKIGYNLESGGKRCPDKYQRKLTDKEILDIREQRFNGFRKKDVFLKYQNKISWSGFEKIWLGTSCPQIGKDLLEKFKNKTRQEYSQEANIGTKNGQAKLTAEQVIQIRYLFEHRNTAKSDRQTILMLSQQYNLSASAIYSIVHYKSYKNIKPVSTIPYVEMQGSSATIDT